MPRDRRYRRWAGPDPSGYSRECRQDRQRPCRTRLRPLRAGRRAHRCRRPASSPRRGSRVFLCSLGRHWFGAMAAERRARPGPAYRGSAARPAQGARVGSSSACRPVAHRHGARDRRRLPGWDRSSEPARMRRRHTSLRKALSPRHPGQARSYACRSIPKYQDARSPAGNRSQVNQRRACRAMNEPVARVEFGRIRAERRDRATQAAAAAAHQPAIAPAGGIRRFR